MRRAAILSFSRQGGETARRIAFLLKREYDCRLFAPEKHAGAARQNKRLRKPFLRCFKKTDWICAPCVKQLPLT